MRNTYTFRYEYRGKIAEIVFPDCTFTQANKAFHAMAWAMAGAGRKRTLELTMGKALLNRAWGGTENG